MDERVGGGGRARGGASFWVPGCIKDHLGRVHVSLFLFSVLVDPIGSYWSLLVVVLTFVSFCLVFAVLYRC